MEFLKSIVGNKLMEKMVFGRLETEMKNNGIKALAIKLTDEGKLAVKVFKNEIEITEKTPDNEPKQ